MSGNVGLNLYNAKEFKEHGEQILKNCEETIKNTAAKSQVVPVGQKEETQKNDRVNIAKNYQLIKPKQKSVIESSNAANNIYKDIQGLRASLEGIKNPQQSEEDELNEVTNASDYMTEKDNSTTNEKMMTLHKNYASKYGDKYFHGSATTANSFQYDFSSKEKGFYSNNNANIVTGGKNSATLINAAFEYGVTSEVKAESTDHSSDKAGEEQKSAKPAATRTDANAEYADPEVPETPPERKEIKNEKSIDVAVLHNREVKISKREYIVGIGADYHNYDNGETTQLTFRGGVADSASGVGLTASTSLYTDIDDDGNRHTVRDTKVKAVVLNNEIDEYSDDENIDDEVQDISNLPIVKTKNKFGAEFVTENKKLGVNTSYVAFDASSLKGETYKRNQLYVKAGYLNDPQDQDEPDIHKIKIGATWKYLKAKDNGDYLCAKVNASYHTSIQHGSTPNYLLGVDANVDAKVGRSEFSVQGTNVKTNNTKFLTLTAGYKYTNKKWDFGVNAGYNREDVYNVKSNYITAEVNAAYKF